MPYHAKAALTMTQRAEVRRLFQSGVSQSELARRFHVDRRTIRRWAERTELADRSSAPHQHGGRVVTEEYRAAVLAYRQANPTHGPKRIAYEVTVQTWGKPPALHQAFLHHMAASWARRPRSQEKREQLPYELHERFPTANTATIWRVLHAAGRSTRAPQKTAAPSTAGRTSSGTDGHSGTASHPR